MNRNSARIFLIAFILGALTTWLAPSAIKFFSNPINEKPRVMGTVAVLTALQKNLENFKKVCGRYPNSLADLPSGSEENPSCELKGLSNKVKPDPWGNDYLYQASSSSFQIISCGNNWIEVKSGDVPKTIEEKE